MSHVLNQRIGHTTRKLCLLAWANHAHKDGTAAYCGVKAVAEYAECDPRTVQRHAATLLAEGWMREGNQLLVAHFPEHQRPIVYDVAMSDAQREQWKADAVLGQRRSVATAQGSAGGRKAAASRKRPGDNLSPGAGVTGVTTPGDTDVTTLVTPVTEPGDTGVTQTVLDPSCEPSNPALASLDAPETVDAVLIEDVDPAAERRRTTNMIVTGWVNWHAQQGPVLESQRTHQMLCKSYVLPALESGYTNEQVKEALRFGGEILPTKAKFRAALLRAAGGRAPQPLVTDQTAHNADFLADRKRRRANGGTST